MFAISTIGDAERELARVYGERFGNARQVVRGPTGLFLVRDDGAKGSRLAKEIVGSFEYWDGRTAMSFDGIFLGWGVDGGAPVPLGPDEFLATVMDLESRTTWRMTGTAALILVDYEYDPAKQRGHFDFSSATPLDLTEIINDSRKFDQLSDLIEEIVRPRKDGAALTSDTIAVRLQFAETRRAFWKRFVQKVGMLLGILDVAVTYAPRDLRKK